jgi:hypothetical protein
MKPAENDVTLAAALQALRDDLAAKAPPSELWTAVREALREPIPPARAAGQGPLAYPAKRLGPSSQRSPRWPRWPAWTSAAAAAAIILLSLALILHAPRNVPEPLAARPLDHGGPARAARAAPAGGVEPVGLAESAERSAAREHAAWTPATHFVPLVSTEHLRVLAGPPGTGPRPGAAAGAPPATAAWVLAAEVPQQHLASFGLPYDPARAAEPLRAELLVSGSGEVLAVRLLF